MLKNILINSTLLITSVVVSLLAAEVVARYMFDPVDVLMATIVPDDDLGHRVAPLSGGHDAWGFRNRRVPKQAEIIAIGDSMTYGMAATMAGSWPGHLGRLTTKKVYSLSLGGYGPLQYKTLLNTKGFSLQPRLVICMVYLGNDIFDTYNFKSGNVVDNVQLIEPTKKTLIKRIRSFFARTSVIYRVASQSPLFDFVRRSEAKAKPSQAKWAGHLLDAKRRGQFIDLEKAELRSAAKRSIEGH